MNNKRIASLLRELADAFEQVEPKRKRTAKVVAPETEQDKPKLDEARRALRRAGFAA